MDPAELNRLFEQAAQRAIAFRTDAPHAPACPTADYAQTVARFCEPLPEHPTPAVEVLDDMIGRAAGGLMMPTGGRFFGWVIGASHPAGVAADWMTSAWGQNAGNHHASPAAAAAETAVAAWLLELLDLPRDAAIGIVTGATMANFTALAAARSAVLAQVGWDADRQGLFGAPPITVLIGNDAHVTVFSALQFLGLGYDRVVRVATDAQGRIRNAAFEAAIANIDGPCIAVLQAGQINTGDFDSFGALIALAKHKGAWVHVDGAFGLWARATPTHKALTTGIEQADSWATDGHKWLQTPYDCGFAIVRHESALRRAMTMSASYLPPAAPGERDPAHYVPELSRRARGFAAWAMIKTLGRRGIAEIVERNCAGASLMAELLSAQPGVVIENEVVLNQVIVRFGASATAAEGDRLTVETIQAIQSDAVCFVSGAQWRDRQVMRVSVIGGNTREEDIRLSARAMIEAYRRRAGAA